MLLCSLPADKRCEAKEFVARASSQFLSARAIHSMNQLSSSSSNYTYHSVQISAVDLGIPAARPSACTAMPAARTFWLILPYTKSVFWSGIAFKLSNLFSSAFGVFSLNCLFQQDISVRVSWKNVVRPCCTYLRSRLPACRSVAGEVGG